ncbi:ferritin-like domain-containing protein [Streptodolium elevatio]|uniref:Ferritin-like domain-containing protein n=1 Tax=Streptodolium elevatio TaxID=3157996 RepID=A0ABV3DN27_9ACTN
MAEFLSDVQTLREKARQEIGKGPVTAAYGADLERVIDVLNTALATEIVCVLRYRQHHFAAKGVHGETVAEEFLVHSNEEQEHADKLAARITQLGGLPDFNPATVAQRSHSQYETSTDLTEMIRENLIAERIAIQSYTEIIGWLGDADPTTRRVFEDILSVEEEHADDMLGFLEKSS